MPAVALPSCSERLAALVTAGSARAQALGRSVLVSVVERRRLVDPLAVLAGWANRAGADAGPRMYWALPHAGVATACVGNVVTVEPSGEDRFAAVNTAVALLLDHAIVDGPATVVDGVGPMFAGGFAFDPGHEPDDRWREFPAARFVLPRVQVTAAGGDGWLTASMLVDADGVPDMDPADLARLCDDLHTGAGPAREGAATGVAFADERSPERWKHLVADAVDVIRSGELDKVVLARARQCRAESPIDAHRVLWRLAAGSPDCFIFGVWQGQSAFVGASPERLVRLDTMDVQASSLAGSAPRGATPDDDRASSAMLASSTKDLAEHALVREALVTALERLCDDIAAAGVPSLFTLPHVHHLHTAVRATLHEGRTLVDLVEALHPTPAVGGAPREAALAYIRAHESLDRGWYAAPVGWIGRGRGEFAVALRSAVVRGSDAWLFAGCGIVAGSDPAAEYEETLLKLRPMEQAITAAQGGAG
ncbi:MAG: isochorismate synthase [Gemmatimonadaceae bacterium]|nr:isochorismate synthase [Gemmatimonadaceae bacterium]